MHQTESAMACTYILHPQGINRFPRGDIAPSFIFFNTCMCLHEALITSTGINKTGMELRDHIVVCAYTAQRGMKLCAYQPTYKCM